MTLQFRGVQNLILLGSGGCETQLQVTNCEGHVFNNCIQLSTIYVDKGAFKTMARPKALFI